MTGHPTRSGALGVLVIGAGQAGSTLLGWVGGDAAFLAEQIASADT